MGGAEGGGGGVQKGDNQDRKIVEIGKCCQLSTSKFKPNILLFQNNSMCYPCLTLCTYQGEKVSKKVKLIEIKTHKNVYGCRGLDSGGSRELG